MPLPTYDPTAPDAERSAWGAALALHSPGPDFDDPMIDGVTPRQIAENTYRAYYEHRTSKKLPLFPRISAEARVTQQEEFRKAYGGLDQLQANLRPEQWSLLEAAAAGDPDPEEYRARAINAAYLKTLVGQEIPPEDLSRIRDAYAKQELGLTDDTSDKAVYNAVRGRFSEDDASSKVIEEASRKAVSSVFNGKAPESIAATIAALPERHRDAAMLEIQRARNEARRMKRKLTPLVDDAVSAITKEVTRLSVPGMREEGNLNFGEILAKMPEDRQERGVALALLATKLKALPEKNKSFFDRSFQMIERGIVAARQGGEDFAGNASIEALDSARKFIAPTDDAAMQEVERYRRYSRDRSDMRELMQTYQKEGDPLERATDNLLQRSVLLAAGSAWTIPASLTGPGGFAFMAQSMAGDSFMEARANNPEAKSGAQIVAAGASGLGQAFVENAVNHLGFKVITGRLPSLAGIMNKIGLESKLARGVAGGIAGMISTGFGEYAEEAVQGGIDRGFQDLALEFSNIDPTTDWGKFWGDWATIAGQEQQDTMLAIMPYAIVGAGGGSFSHFRYGKALSKNKEVLRAIGVPEAKVQEITRSTDVEAADRAMREAFEQGLEARTAEQRAAVLNVLREQNALLEKAGIPRVTQEVNSFTDETLHVFTDPATGERAEFETEDAALEHWRDYALNAREDEMDMIAEAARVGAVEFLTGEGMASEGTKVEDVGVTMTPDAALKRGIITKEQLASRIQLFVLQEGLTPEQAAKEAGNLTIKARRFSEQARDGQFRYTVQLFRGANVMDVFEDLSEDSFARALDEGFADGEILLDDIRQFEDATGQKLLPDSYDYDSSNRMPLLEALSKLSRAHLLGNVRADMLPPEIAKWVELNTTIYSQTLLGAQNLSADITRAGILKEALAAGNVSPRLERLIADSIGINSEALEHRLTKKMEAQLAAEAMGGFPEIGEEARGQIPHPDTLKSNQHPLAGEVRRLWESMKKTTRRKTKDGKAVDRTNEANAFFLPVGEMVDLDQVRQRMNQKGFDFDTPADMLDALDTSLSYGKPVYGVNSRGFLDDSFSVGSLKSALLDRIGEEGLRVEQPKVSYEAKQKLLEDFAASIVGETEGSGEGEASGMPPDGRNVSGRLGSLATLQQKLAWDISVDTEVKFVGEIISSPEDLAVKAMALRNPRFETFYLFAMKIDDAGFRIADVMAITNRVPCSASVFTGQSWAEGMQEHEAFLKNAGAKHYMILHNHPSGDPSPSRADVQVTIKHAMDMEKMGFTFLDHLVINHRTYTRIDDVGGVHSGSLDNDAGGELVDPYAWPHFGSAIGFDVSSPNDVMMVAKRLEESRADPSNLVGIFTDSRGKSVAAVMGTEEQFSSLTRDQIQEYARDQGAIHLFLHAKADSTKEAEAMLRRFESMNRENLVSELVVEAPFGKSSTQVLSGNEKGIFRYPPAFFGGASAQAVRVQDSSFSLSSENQPAITNTHLHENHQRRRPGPGAGESQEIQRETEAESRRGISENLAGRVGEAWKRRRGDGTESVVFSYDEGRVLKEIKPAGVNRYNRTGGYTSEYSFEAVAEKAAIINLLGGMPTSAFEAEGGRVFLIQDEGTPITEAEYQEIRMPFGIVPSKGNVFRIEIDGRHFLISDLHRENFMKDATGEIRLTDLVTGEVSAQTSALPEIRDESFALSPAGINRIEAAIAKKLTANPDERAEFYERVRHNLASITQRLQDMDAGIGPFARKETDAVGEERRRIQDAIAEARAIINALPSEARGRVDLNFNDITGATSERGRVNALLRLIGKADDALEIVLKKEYLESFERLLDLAKPNLLGKKQIRGRLTPETQRLVQKISDVVNLTATEAAMKMQAEQAAIDKLEENPPTDPDEIAAKQQELIQHHLNLHFLETFATLTGRTSGELSHAHQELLTVYTRGRTARQILDENNRAEIQAAKREVLDSLPTVTQATHSKRTQDKGLLDLAEAARLGLSSFHQVMETLFPKSQTARRFQEEIRANDRAFTRAKIDARERFEEFMRSAFKLDGISARRKGNKILAKISTRRDDWNIQLKEGVKFETEKMTEEQAAAILDGTLKTGWESDPIAMESLRQALADFRLQRLKARNEEKAFTAKVVRFQRLTSRGAPSWMHLSDLEAVYFLQLAGQDQYLPALDKYGFTAGVLDEMRAKLDPEAVKLSTFLRREYDSEYDRLNPVFRNLYGLDMPRIRNYAPGMFEHLDGKADSNAMDAYGNPSTPVNAMSAGFTKARTHHMARPRQMNAMGAFWSHLEATEYFIAYAETMRDMRQIFRNPDVRRALEGNYGTRAASVFSTWLDAIEVDGRFRAATVAALQEATANTMATQSAIGLAFNVGVLFKQFSAVIGVMMEMETTHAIKGIIGTLAKPSSLKHVWGTESIQQRILAGMSPEDRRLLDAAHASPSLVMEMLEIGRLPIAYADAAFTTASAAIAYNHHLAEATKNGLNAKQAEQVALEAMDRVVTRTAQPATTQDKSLAEVTANGFGRFLFLFKSDPRQKFATAAQAIKDRIDGKISTAEATRRVFWSWAIYGLLAEVATDIWSNIARDDDDAEKWSVGDYVAAAIAGPIAGIPLIGAGISYAITSMIGDKAYSNSANPIDSAVNRLFRDGFTSATWKLAMSDKPLDLTDLLTAAQRDTSAVAQLAGVVDPRFAIVPAGIRAVRDVAGILGNTSEIIFGESKTKQQRKIIAAELATEKKERGDRGKEVKKLVKELKSLTPEARAARLRPLEKGLRESLEMQLRHGSMTANERSLSGMSKDARKRVVDKITATMDQKEKDTYLARLKSLKLI